jgi:hypothetical protein
MQELDDGLKQSVAKVRRIFAAETGLGWWEAKVLKGSEAAAEACRPNIVQNFIVGPTI